MPAIAVGICLKTAESDVPAFAPVTPASFSIPKAVAVSSIDIFMAEAEAPTFAKPSPRVLKLLNWNLICVLVKTSPTLTISTSKFLDAVAIIEAILSALPLVIFETSATILDDFNASLVESPAESKL